MYRCAGLIVALASSLILTGCMVDEPVLLRDLKVTPNRVINKGDTLTVSGSMEFGMPPATLRSEINGPWGRADSFFHLAQPMEKFGNSPTEFRFQLVLDSVRQGYYDLTLHLDNSSDDHTSETVRFAVDYRRKSPQLVDSVMLGTKGSSPLSFLQLANSAKSAAWTKDSASKHPDWIDLVLKADSAGNLVLMSPDLASDSSSAPRLAFSKQTLIGDKGTKIPSDMTPLEAETRDFEYFQGKMTIQAGHSYYVLNDDLTSTAKLLYVARLTNRDSSAAVIQVYNLSWGTPRLGEPK
ncbi:MAG: hypothetical protein IPK50_09590 [Fibrobacterota bacterium]|nr:hypothetical protein [Fibrobacterota bacterium]QQS07131.1 MAG: hypothetical protein IPK50_09590 [Fibrobacterota bacterium]